MTAMSFGAVCGWPTHLSWWALLIGLIISLVWTIPIGIIYATTNIHLGLNVFIECIIGYMQPGRSLVMMLFKTYGYITMNQAHAFLADLKLGHYLKIPQRPMFFGQVIATLWSCLVQLAVMEWALGHIKDICKEGQPNNLTCPNGRVFFSASVIFGLIGPRRIFSMGALYGGLQWFWLAGALAPFLVYAGARAFPRSKIRFFSTPIFFGGMGNLPPATPLSFLSWSIVSFVFQKYIHNRYRGWWMRFNYITSAALDVGLVICTIVIITALNLTTTSFPRWWGNTAPAGTLDYKEIAIQKKVANGTTFGLSTWLV